MAKDADKKPKKPVKKSETATEDWTKKRLKKKANK